MTNKRIWRIDKNQIQGRADWIESNLIELASPDPRFSFSNLNWRKNHLCLECGQIWMGRCPPAVHFVAKSIFLTKISSTKYTNVKIERKISTQLWFGIELKLHWTWIEIGLKLNWNGIQGLGFREQIHICMMYTLKPNALYVLQCSIFINKSSFHEVTYYH